MDWRARHHDLRPNNLLLRFSVWGGCLTHGELALEAHVDFLAVVEHSLIPAWVRCEWTRWRAKGLASTWAPAPQDISHVGNLV